MVPFDFSAESLAGVRFAAVLAERCSLELMLLNIIEPLNNHNENVQADVFQKSFSDFVKVLPKNISIRQMVETGRFLHVVLSQIVKENPAMVVIGTKGSRGWEGSFVGSHAEKIVRMAPIPVFAIKNDFPANGIRNIVLPYDKTCNVEKLIPFAQYLHILFQAQINFLKIKKGTNGKIILNNFLSTSNCEVDAKKATGDTIYAATEAESILRYALETAADMIAVPTYGSRSIGKMFGPSVPADIVNHSKVATCSFPVGFEVDPRIWWPFSEISLTK